MSILKPTEENITLSNKDMINIIAADLNVNASAISLITHQKEVATDYFTSGRLGFDKLTAVVKENNVVSKSYDISQDQIKELIASHLKTSKESLDLRFTFNYEPDFHTEQITQINVINKSPKNAEILSSIKALREDSFSSDKTKTPKLY